MSRAGRLKNMEKDAARAAKLLPELVTAVGDMYGTETECIEATALLCIVAGRLGITLRPLAVSIFAYSPSLGALALTGERALAEGKARGLIPRDLTLDDFPGDRPWSEVGHMIGQSSAPFMILDPAFRQFSKSGLPAISIAAPVQPLTPERGGEWRLSVPGTDIEVIYFDAVDYTDWRESFEGVKPQLRGDADTLTRWFRAGGNADGLRRYVIPPTFFPNGEAES